MWFLVLDRLYRLWLLKRSIVVGESYSTSRGLVTVVALNRKKMLACVKYKGGKVGLVEYQDLKPPKTKAEREVAAMISACPYPASESTRIDCEALHKAGYRKQER